MTCHLRRDRKNLPVRARGSASERVEARRTACEHVTTRHHGARSEGWSGPAPLDHDSVAAQPTRPTRRALRSTSPRGLLLFGDELGAYWHVAKLSLAPGDLVLWHCW